MRHFVVALVALVPCMLGCADLVPPVTCGEGEELTNGVCVDRAKRYEPAERVDTDNVVAFGEPLTQLTLPDPPKSGFRIIAPPRELAPGEEISTCLSWPYPTFKNHIIYAARLYTTPGLHHSNLIAKPVSPDTGPNPYPTCHPGSSDPFADVGLGIPDVLFANSTQITGEETLAFPPGLGFRVDPSREMVTDYHLLNTSSEPIRAEVAYDFFTMPEELLTDEVAPFTLSVDDFAVPPHSTGDVGTSCAVFGGNVVEMMPHTHKLRKSFTVDFVDTEGQATPFESWGAFDSKSEIRVYDTPVSIDGVSEIAFSCRFENPYDKTISYGIGDNEMCILFGYLYPVKAQFAGHAPSPEEPCKSYQLGLFK